MKEIRVSYNEVHLLAEKLARMIKSSGFEPDLVLAIGSGGFFPGVIIKKRLGIPLFAVVVQRYYDDGKEPLKNPIILQWVSAEVIGGKNIIIADEVCDEGNTLRFVIGELKKTARGIVVAVIHRKKRPENLPLVADWEFPFFAAKTVPNRWIAYPWDIVGGVGELP